jgi:hypothetical protein
VEIDAPEVCLSGSVLEQKGLLISVEFSADGHQALPHATTALTKSRTACAARRTASRRMGALTISIAIEMDDSAASPPPA